VAGARNYYGTSRVVVMVRRLHNKDLQPLTPASGQPRPIYFLLNLSTRTPLSLDHGANLN